MTENRETQLLNASLSRLQKIGMILFWIFAVCAAFFFLLLIVPVNIIFQSGGKAATAFYGALPGIVQYASMGLVFLLCSLVARTVSKGNTPFTKKQSRRVVTAGCIFLAYTLFCTLYPQIAFECELVPLEIIYGVYPGLEPGDLNLNFETFIASCSFFLFAFILSYGRTLQELSDETL